MKIDWTDAQKAQIWKLYTEEQLNMVRIAERFGHLGATKNAISGVITRIKAERSAQVDIDIETAKKRSGTYTTRRGPVEDRKVRDLKKPCRNPPLTQEEIEKLKEVRK